MYVSVYKHSLKNETVSAWLPHNNMPERFRMQCAIWAPQPLKLHPYLPCSRSNSLIGWKCLWLGLKHNVYFPFTEPELCMNTVFVVVFSVSKQTTGGPREAIHWIRPKVYWIRIVDCASKSAIEGVDRETLTLCSCIWTPHHDDVKILLFRCHMLSQEVITVSVQWCHHENSIMSP